MEPLRMFAVQSVQQAQTRKFEGQPYTPWENPYRHSLPPAPDVPKKKKRVVSPARDRAMHDRPRASPEEMERRKTVIYQMLEQHKTWREIAEALEIPVSHLYSMKTRLGIKTTPVIPVMVAVATDIAKAAFFVFEVPVLPPLITRTARVSTEPRSGTYVLDWGRRMDSYEYTDAPEGCLPKKPKIRRVVPCKADFRNVYGYPRPGMGMRINSKRSHNCAAPPARPRSPFD